MAKAEFRIEGKPMEVAPPEATRLAAERSGARMAEARQGDKETRRQGEEEEVQSPESKVEAPGPSPLEDSQLRTGVADAAPQDSEPSGGKTQDSSLHDKVVAAISEVYDPEIPVNIYELGLIYDVAIDDANHVKVTMTLTSAACPAAQELPVEVRKSVECIPEVSGSEVDLVFDPPWSMEKMSDEAKLALGLL